MIPDELKALNQWVVWTKVLKDGKLTKMPFRPNGKPASTSDPQTWSTYDEVIVSASKYSGIGFVFIADDPYCGIDLDKCIVDGKQTEAANKLLKCLMSYSERSQSGEGIHIIVKANNPGDRCKFNKLPGMKEMEIYDSNRFFIMTGQHINGTPNQIMPRQQELDVIYGRALARQGVASPPRIPIGEAGQTHAMSDEYVIRALESAKNGDRFKRLYYGGDISDFGFDASRADLALCSMIAFYTQDNEQIERIMRESIIARDKWDRNKRYLERTIAHVLSTLTSKYSKKNA